MPRSRTIVDMVAEVRRRTNFEDSTFVLDTEIADYINSELVEVSIVSELYAGTPVRTGSYEFTTVANLSVYDLPIDVWLVQRVSARRDGVERPMSPFMARERGAVERTNVVYDDRVADGPWYRLIGDDIEVLPPSAGTVVRVEYTPASPVLSVGTIDGVNGFEMAAVFGACAAVAAKEESDPSYFLGQKTNWIRLVTSAVQRRDRSMPQRVQDVKGRRRFDF
jgi:hypothetical protein